MPKTNPAGTNEEEEVVDLHQHLHLQHHLWQEVATLTKIALPRILTALLRAFVGVSPTNLAGTNEEVLLQQRILLLHRHIHQVTQLWRSLHQAILLQWHLQHHHQQKAMKSHLWATSTSRKRIVFCNHQPRQVSHRHQLLLQLLHQLFLRLLHQPPHKLLLHLQHHL